MTPDLAAAIASPSHWIIVLVTLVLVAAAVGLHYEALERLNDWLPRWRLPARPRILVLITCILLVHIAEIWIFGIGIFLVVQHPELGQVAGAASIKLLDAVYLSTTTFTTIGYGDLTPHGPVRLILGSEGLTGLVLITWSASFTYLEMQRYWRPR
jgi:hypothetical protein